MKMPFGKHKGHHLAELPNNYIEWLMGRDLHSPLAEAVRREYDLRRRNGEYDQHQKQQYEHKQRQEYGRPQGRAWGSGAPALVLRTDDLQIVRQIIDAGYKAVARTLHPDVGGNTAGMQALN